MHRMTFIAGKGYQIAQLGIVGIILGATKLVEEQKTTDHLLYICFPTIFGVRQASNTVTLEYRTNASKIIGVN